MTTAEIRAACACCGVGCRLLPRPDRAVGTTGRGDPDHAAYFGRLWPEGAGPGKTLPLEDRLAGPRVDGKETDWDNALDHLPERFRRTAADHGPDAVALFVSGQLPAEDYDVADRLMKGFTGSANTDANPRLCVAAPSRSTSAPSALIRCPGPAKAELADLVVAVGSNLAWCHPVL